LDVSGKRKAKPKQRPRRRRRTLVVLAIAVPLAVLAATAAGGAVYFGSSCDLGALRPVRQADNSLVYGANGDLIGVLPAVENRTAVTPAAINPWMPKATVAIEDRPVHPLHDPAAALARRAAVLHALRRSGDITDAQYAAETRDHSLHLRPSPAYASREPYFVGYVENLLQQAYGAATVRAGGLRIYTTVRPRLQRAAVRALSEELHARRDPAGTIVSIDPATGAIRAMAAVTPGTPGNEFNLATTAERQAGSTFKPIVLAAAVAAGLNPWATRYVSAPFYYAPLQWRVRTYDGSYAGPETVAAATLRSDNTVYARLALDVGPDAIVSTARKLGVQTELQSTPSLALGTGAVTPLDMASVYATLAAGGVYSRPLAIRRVVFPGGKAGGGWGQAQRTRVLPDWGAATVTRVLEENMLHGTGVGAHVPGRVDAGKTGPPDDYG